MLLLKRGMTAQLTTDYMFYVCEKSLQKMKEMRFELDVRPGNTKVIEKLIKDLLFGEIIARNNFFVAEQQSINR